MAFTVSTPNSASAWRPDQFAFAPSDAVPDALISTITTVAGSIEGDEPVLKVAFLDDDTASFVAEGSTIPEGQPDLSEAIIHTSKVSKLLRITSEQYRQAGTPAQLAQSVSRAITRRADQALLVEAAPTAPAVAPAAGLLNTTGVVSGGAVTDDLDVLVDLISTLQVNLATPSNIVVGPQAWAALRKLKESATANNVSLLGAGTSDAQQLLLSLPVTVNNAITTSAGLIIDKTAVVSAVGQVQVATSTDAYFTADSVGYRVTWRIGHAVPRANRIGKFTVA